MTAGEEPGTAVLSWTPIQFTGTTGHYEVCAARTPGGPHTSFSRTADKLATGLTWAPSTPSSPARRRTTASPGWCWRRAAGATGGAFGLSALASVSVLDLLPAVNANGTIGRAVNLVFGTINAAGGL